MEVRNQKRSLAKEIFEIIQARVLKKVSAELYSGLVEYGMLVPVSQDAAETIKSMVMKTMKPLNDIPVKEQTPTIISEASSILQELHTGFIDAGLLKFEPPNLMQRAPDARKYMNGDIEAVDKVNDMDHTLITQYVKEQMKRMKKSVPGMQKLLVELKEEAA
jgi:hypothetical protein